MICNKTQNHQGLQSCSSASWQYICSYASSCALNNCSSRPNIAQVHVHMHCPMPKHCQIHASPFWSWPIPIVDIIANRRRSKEDDVFVAHGTALLMNLNGYWAALLGGLHNLINAAWPILECRKWNGQEGNGWNCNRDTGT